MKRKRVREIELVKKAKTSQSVLGKRKFVDDEGRPLLRPKGPGDWTLPGYNYLGPGNPTHDGYLPVDEDDRLAMTHDDDYADISKSDQNPYLKYSDEDQTAKDQFGYGYGGWLGKAFFQTKKLLTPNIDQEKLKVEQAKDVGIERNVKKFDVDQLAIMAAHPLPASSRTIEGKLPRKGPVEESLFNLPSMTKDKPKVIPIDDDVDMGGEEPTLMRSAGAAPAGLSRGHGETKVSPFTDVQLRPFPTTQNCIMPYYAQGSLTIGATQTETAVAYLTIRQNSIYDVLTTRTHSEDAAPVADSADGTVNTPIMRGFWSGIYKYWTVVGSTYKVRFWSEDQVDQEFEIFCYQHGQQTPPVINGSGTTGNVLWRKYRLMHPNMYYRTLRLRDPTNTELGNFDRDVAFTGTYDPNNSINDVEEDEFAQTWHRVTEVPQLHEQLSFIVQRSERSKFANEVTIKYDMEMVYHVQWKNLKASLKYPYPAADLSITDYANQGN